MNTSNEADREESGVRSSPDHYDLTLFKYAFGGEAMGRLPDGRAAFVPFALPDETVRIRLLEDKRGYVRGELLEVLTPSPKRIPPRCVHFTQCGGCQYQHLTYEEQLAAKSTILFDQLQRIGGINAPPVNPTVAAPSPWLYRNHVQFHLTPAGQLGYHAARAGRVIPIEECFLPEKNINELWPLLEIEPIPSLKRIHLRQGAGEEMLLIFESQDPEPYEFSVDLPLAAVHLGPAGPQVLAGQDYLIAEVKGRAFRVSAESFFQTNTAMAEIMVEHVLSNINFPAGTVAMDVYCGVGLFSAFLAPRVEQLVAVEASPSACDDFIVNLGEFNHIELYQAPAEEVLPFLDLRPDVMLVDPPRAGLSRKVLDSLLSLSPPELVYVSCDPATLARDAKRLIKGGYRLAQTTPFDLFPQTKHIESISFWDKR
jgi:23S rRNA (uracil1939-C5)-methyltransferase